jgi:hypothetical protein
MVKLWKASRPARPKSLANLPVCMTSQPSPTSITAPKLGLAAVPHRVRRSTSKPSPLSAMPQPEVWVIGTTPSTLG